MNVCVEVGVECEDKDQGLRELQGRYDQNPLIRTGYTKADPTCKDECRRLSERANKGVTSRALQSSTETMKT